MADRLALDPESLRAAREQEDRANFDQWQKWRDGFRNTRNDFHNEGGLPDAPPNVAEILDSLLLDRKTQDILEALTRELNSTSLFHSTYAEFIKLMHARGLIDGQQMNDYLAAGKALVETQQSSQVAIGIQTGNPVIDEALKDM
jgi:hypothetical protein